MRAKAKAKVKPAYAGQTEPYEPPFAVNEMVKYEGTRRWAEKVTYGSIGEVMAAMPGWITMDGEIHNGYSIIAFQQGRVGVTRKDAQYFAALGKPVDKPSNEE